MVEIKTSNGGRYDFACDCAAASLFDALADHLGYDVTLNHRGRVRAFGSGGVYTGNEKCSCERSSERSSGRLATA